MTFRFLSGYQFNQQMNGGGGVFFPGFTGFNGGGGAQMSCSAPPSQRVGQPRGQSAAAPLQHQLLQIGETVVMTTRHGVLCIHAGHHPFSS